MRGKVALRSEKEKVVDKKQKKIVENRTESLYISGYLQQLLQRDWKENKKR